MSFVLNPQKVLQAVPDRRHCLLTNGIPLIPGKLFQSLTQIKAAYFRLKAQRA